MDESFIVYERTRLYDEIWAEPMRKVAKRYGVSDVALAKTCRRLAVPVPERGYWAKLKAGKATQRPPLPPLGADARERVVVRRPRPRAPKPAPLWLVRLDEASPIAIAQPIVVSETLENPHRLVALSARYLEKTQPENGLLSARRRSCLDIRVSPSSLDRALRIADALLKALEAAGLPVEVVPLETEHAPRPSYYGDREPKAEPPPRITGVHCGDEWIAFCLSERIPRSVDEGPPARSPGSPRLEPRIYSYEPTGQLTLTLTSVEGLGVQTTWKDTKKQPLEQRLEEFVAYLSSVALAFRLKREDDERHRVAAVEAEHRRYEEQLRRWEEEERRRKEEERGKRLEAEVARWRRAEDIRAYVEVASRLLDGKPDSEEVRRRRAELAWLLEHAERIDPLRSPRGEIR